MAGTTGTDWRCCDDEQSARVEHIAPLQTTHPTRVRIPALSAASGTVSGTVSDRESIMMTVGGFNCVSMHNVMGRLGMRLAVVAVLALAGCRARETVVMIQEDINSNETNSSTTSCTRGAPYVDSDRCVVKCPAGVPPSLHVTP